MMLFGTESRFLERFFLPPPASPPFPNIPDQVNIKLRANVYRPD
jgi:hypothetical protein